VKENKFRLSFYEVDAVFQAIWPINQAFSRVSEAAGCYCAKKERELYAVRKMREGPSEPFYWERFQTATSCCGTMAAVVNVVVKRCGSTTSCVDKRDERKQTCDQASKGG
jgi:hypothetical protein